MLIYTAKRGDQVLGRWTSATDLNHTYRNPAWGDATGITVDVFDTDTDPAVIAFKAKQLEIDALKTKFTNLKRTDIDTPAEIAQALLDFIEIYKHELRR